MKIIYLSRHGESAYNKLGKIGGNSDLTKEGILYADKLGKYINNLEKKIPIYTSTLIRTINTGKYINNNKISISNLDEINAGICEHLTYSEIKDKYPEEYSKRILDKFNYKYPKGESYKDLIIRTKPIIDIINNSEIILIIAHQAVLRVIYGILTNKNEIDFPNIEIPLHTLITLNIDKNTLIENNIKFI